MTSLIKTLLSIHLKQLDLVKEIDDKISNLTATIQNISALSHLVVLENLLEDLIIIKIALTVYPIFHIGSISSINSSIDICNNLIVTIISKINSLK